MRCHRLPPVSALAGWVWHTSRAFLPLPGSVSHTLKKALPHLRVALALTAQMEHHDDVSSHVRPLQERGNARPPTHEGIDEQDCSVAKLDYCVIVMKCLYLYLIYCLNQKKTVPTHYFVYIFVFQINFQKMYYYNTVYH